MPEPHHRGAVLGALYAAALGIAFTMGSQASGHGIVVIDDWTSVAIFMIAWSLPIATALTMGAGSTAKRLAKTTPVLRGCVYIGFAIATLTIATPFWIDLVPWAILPTIGYAIAFEYWLVRPHVHAAPQPQRSLISRVPLLAALEKGAVLGASAAIVIAIDHALEGQRSSFCGLLRCPWFVDDAPTFRQLFAALAMHAIPIGILWGVLVGYIAHTTRDPLGRWAAVLSVSLFGICIFSMAWPRLLEPALGIGLVHAVVLLGWTRHRPAFEFPIARPIARPRSTCSRGARSRGPRPTRSDTSRTTRSR